MTRVTAKRWRSLNDDPQIIIAPKLFRAKFIIITIHSENSFLDPCLYLDQGEGYDPDEEIELNAAYSAIYIVNMKGNHAPRRVRFDPSTFPAEYIIEIFVGHNEHEVTAFVGNRLQDLKLQDHTHQAICQQIDVGNNPSAPTKRSTLRPQQFYEQIIAMAAIKYSKEKTEIKKPIFSFVTPVYNATRQHLDQLFKSLKLQPNGSWELILSDDGSTAKETLKWYDKYRDNPSIKIICNEKNEGIAAATNKGIGLASGEWVSFIDHDDALAPYALHSIISALKAYPDAQLLYTDEVITNKSLQPKGFFLKPAFDPILLSCVNYINHLAVFKRDRLEQIGRLRAGFDGSQDYDLLLRYIKGLKSHEIIHLPFPAYLWRRHDASFTSHSLHQATQHARNALSEAYSSPEELIEIGEALDKTLHRPRFDKLKRDWPGVSIVIPSKNGFHLISRILKDIENKTDYPKLEIIIEDNGSTDKDVLDLYADLKSNRILNTSIQIQKEDFNFSKSINRGINRAKYDYILLLNNDIEIIDSNWLKEMVSCFDYPDVGIVGARLLYPNNRLQHAGVIVGLGSVAGHWFCGAKLTQSGPMNRLKVRQSFSAVTGACMLISRQCIQSVGAFDEKNFAISYNDIDFCLRAQLKGHRILWTPFASLYHHESATRGSDETKQNIDRFNQEKANLREKYNLTNFNDPAFSPWNTKEHANPKLFIPPKLPEARRFEAQK